MPDPFAGLRAGLPDPFAGLRRAFDPEDQEEKFKAWYAAQAKRWGLAPDPDDPEHRYDYRAAFKAGQGPDPKTGHWPSEFKADDHPNRFVGIIDTKTGTPAPAWLRSELAKRELEPLPGGLAASPAARAAVEQGRLPDLGTVDTSDPEVGGLGKILYGPSATEKGVARDKARVADAGFGWVVGGLERLGAVPEGTRGALREAALEAEEEYNLAHPGGGVGRAVSEAAQTAVASMAGPQALLGPGVGGLAGRGAVALGAGRGLATAAGAAGGALEGAGQNWLDVADLPPEEQARAVALGAGLGGLGGSLAGRAARQGAGLADEAAVSPRASVEPPPPREVLQDAPRLPASEAPVPPPAVQPDRRSNLGFRQDVDDALAALRQQQPDQVRLADIQAKAEQTGDRAMELATERYAFERGEGFFGPPPGSAPGVAQGMAAERPPPPAAARVADDLPPGPGLPPREPEIGAPGAAGGVSRETSRLARALPGGERVSRPLGDDQISPTEALEHEGLAGLLGKNLENNSQKYSPRMSTKGIENVAGMQDELAEVARANRDEIYAARGAPVPTSRWHDAEGLAQKTGLTPDDYLKMPPGRTLNPDEGALGRHYLGGMKQQARELEQRIARGEIDDMAAAVAEKDARNRDVVRMMAVLQAQGSSEFGRYGRMLQEALDPYQLAETPKERLQLALLKNYGAKNAEAAAAIEQRAVARLRRQAARETRKAARAVSAQELSAEFSSLASSLGDLIKHPKGMGGGPVPLDPELVAVIGRMASNRVKAGVIAVEELVDHVYTAVRQYAGDAITREQVKASLVEHALAKPAKLSREETRVRQAEAAARKSIEKMEASVAAGGAKASRPAPVSSPALEKLRARQAELREQLAALRAKPPTDPAVRRLKTAEAAAARRVKLLEEKLAAGPKLPGAKSAAAESERLSALRQRAADLRSQIEKDPRHALVQRYRELLDEDTVEMISKLPDPEENPEALVNFLRQMERPRFRDYAGAFAYQNMLSGPKSLVRNVIGNTVKRWDRIVMQPVAAGFEAVLAPLQGRVRERYVREVLPAVVGSYRGAPEGLRKGLFVLKNGYDPERLIDDLTGVKGNSKYYEAGRLPLDPFLLSQHRAVRAFGAINGWGIRGMQIGDVMARTRNFSSASHAWATRKALMEGAKGDAVAVRAAELLAEQPDEMVEYARRIAREDTFQDEVSNIARLVGSARREETGLGWALQQTVRFLNVPDRIAAWLADYTPGLRVAGAAWKGGKLRQAWGTPEASDILARQAFGTAVAGAAAAWAFEGKLTGAAPRDEKLRSDFYAAGKQPWSVLIGGEWVPIRDAFGGWAAPVAAAAAFHDNALTGEPVDSEEILRRSGGAALGEMRYLLDANYMSNLSDTVAAIEAEPGEAGQELGGLAARTAAGALIPQSGLLRNVAIYWDPRVVDKQGPLDEIKAALPGLREELPSRYGNRGEPLVQNTGKAGGFLPVVPTENTIADPGLAEDVERLRHTVARRRTEINRVVDQIKDARKSKDAARERELKALLPAPADRVQGDAALARVRGLEAKIRKLRADEKIPVERRRLGEIALQKQMQKILADALRRMGSE